jgi:hypothetical protein
VSDEALLFETNFIKERGKRGCKEECEEGRQEGRQEAGSEEDCQEGCQETGRQEEVGKVTFPRWEGVIFFPASLFLERENLPMVRGCSLENVSPVRALGSSAHRQIPESL